MYARWLSKPGFNESGLSWAKVNAPQVGLSHFVKLVENSWYYVYCLSITTTIWYCLNMLKPELWIGLAWKPYQTRLISKAPIHVWKPSRPPPGYFMFLVLASFILCVYFFNSVSCCSKKRKKKKNYVDVYRVFFFFFFWRVNFFFLWSKTYVDRCLQSCCMSADGSYHVD